MGQITISGTASYGTDTLSTSAVLDAEGFSEAVITATTTYVQILDPLSSAMATPQAVGVYNAGDVEVSVRLQYNTTKYYFLTVPPSCCIVVPQCIMDGATLRSWEALSIKCLSGTAAVEYVVIH